MKNLKTILLFAFLLSVNSFLSAQTEEKKQTPFILENDTPIKEKNPKLYLFNQNDHQFQLEDKSISQTPFTPENSLWALPQSTDEYKVTPKGLVDEFGNTQHILIQKPNIDHLAKMPVKKY